MRWRAATRSWKSAPRGLAGGSQRHSGRFVVVGVVGQIQALGFGY